MLDERADHTAALVGLWVPLDAEDEAPVRRLDRLGSPGDLLRWVAWLHLVAMAVVIGNRVLAASGASTRCQRGTGTASSAGLGSTGARFACPEGRSW